MINNYKDIGLKYQIPEHEIKIFLEEKLSKNINEVTQEELIANLSEIKLLNSLPLQYLLNKAWFFGKEFKINHDVLIPRPETEYVLDKTLNFLDKNHIKPKKILDLCSGSGALGIILQIKFPNAKVTCVDLYDGPIKNIKMNIKLHNLNIEVVKSDLFANLNESYDLIICNPPYLDINEEVCEKTLNNEPKVALFAKKKGLEFYEKISQEIDIYLNKNGVLSFETNDEQFEQIKSYFSNLELMEENLDYNKRQRNIIFRRNS